MYIPLQSRAMSNERLTIGAAASGLTLAKYRAQTPKGFHANAAKISVSGATLMMTEDGTTPTAIVGTPQYVGDVFYLNGYEAISKFKAIRAVGDATIDVVYYN